MSLFGDRAAAALARAWCHKMEYLFHQWLRSDDAEFAYTEAHVVEYAEPAWLAQAIEGAPAATLPRLSELRDLRPSAGSSSSGAA